jgi:hypothetical protein
MGTVFKKKFTKPLPADAEVAEKGGKRVARWKQGRKSPHSPCDDRQGRKAASGTAFPGVRRQVP